MTLSRNTWYPERKMEEVEGVFCRVGDWLDRYGGGTEKRNKFLLRDTVDLAHPGVMTKK